MNNIHIYIHSPVSLKGTAGSVGATKTCMRPYPLVTFETTDGEQLYMYIYMYIHIYIYIYIYVHIYIFIFKFICMYVYILVFKYTQIEKTCVYI
jgi:hypothetical protein